MVLVSIVDVVVEGAVAEVVAEGEEVGEIEEIMRMVSFKYFFYFTLYPAYSRIGAETPMTGFSDPILCLVSAGTSYQGVRELI